LLISPHHLRILMRYAVALIIALLLVSVFLNFYLITQIVHPRPLVVWNVPATVEPNSYLFSTMFDTFKMSINIRANSTVYVYVFTPSEFVDFYESGGAVRNPVQSYAGDSISFTFNLSTGCAGYIWVIYNPSNTPVVIKPYVTAVYSPSSQATGVCSHTQGTQGIE